MFYGFGIGLVMISMMDISMNILFHGVVMGLVLN